MDNDAIQFQPTNSYPPSRRTVLWDELERLHEQFGMSPPTASLTIEALEAEVNRLKEQLARQQRTT